MQKYIKSVYENSPDDLNADIVLPEMESYLSDRMDEEINRIQSQKKPIALDQYTQVYEDETLESILEHESIFVDIEINDLLVEELYSKERGVRVLFFWNSVR